MQEFEDEFRFARYRMMIIVLEKDNFKEISERFTWFRIPRWN